MVVTKEDIEYLNELFGKRIKEAEVKGINLAMMWRCPYCSDTFPEEEQVLFALHYGDCKGEESSIEDECYLRGF